MSIIATMMFPNVGVIMYGDKRGVTHFHDKTATTDRYVKVHRIKKSATCGITGYAEWGMSLIDRLISTNFNSVANMIEFIKSYPYPVFNEAFHSTVTLAGIYDDNRPFIFTYKTSGDITFNQEGINYSIATNPLELGDSCGEHLKEEFGKTLNPHSSLISVIKFASIRNPGNISECYDVIVIPYKM
jgi:hypothetical protein